ncbi:tetratricopeptide repeat-containing diguanylate cyclase [Spirochaeta isovalerica]|uniref:Diguanylate cyclase (GGDEF)-like protein n=1 Tax=Spirochaeta isovalerica TaxID=150 RepID=A0A841R7A2_9SPIO|nr:diguanylate cyclase [Spirochaeta isovalerica]MBB6478920.1 diguanylate cyclase (GGDEF)-like protein [Spirochaeta isovalerica]
MFATIEDQIRSYNQQAEALTPDKAGEMLNLAKKAFSLAEAENFNKLGAEAQALMGIAYYYLLEIDKSLEYLNYCYDTALKYQFADLISYASYNMGIVYRYLDDKEKALTLFHESLANQDDANTIQKLSTLKALAETHRDLGQYTEAAGYTESALLIAKELEEQLIIQELQLLSGDIAYKNGNLRESVSRLIAIIRETSETAAMTAVRSSAMSLLGRNYARLNDNTRALSYGQDALLLAVSSGDEPNRLEAYSSLAFIYRQMNQFEEAYNYLSLYYKQKEIYDSGKNEKNLNSIKAYYETLEKEKEIDEQRVRIASQNRLIIYGTLLLVGLLALLFIFYQLYRRNQRVVEKLSRDLKKEMVLSKTDAVTGLPNRKAIEEKIREAFLQWKTDRKDFSLLFISFSEYRNLDKDIEDGAGEKFQKFIGDLLNTELKGQDFIALWKPFLFSVLLPSTDRESLILLGERLEHSLIEQRFKINDKEMSLSYTTASAVYSGEGTMHEFIDSCKNELKTDKTNT